MNINKNELKTLIAAMRQAYAEGKNMMAEARELNNSASNSVLSTMISYDLQSGSYSSFARENPQYINAWTAQLANHIKKYITSADTLLEVGVGEATTLCGVIEQLKELNINAYGFDISWSRIMTGLEYLKNADNQARLFVANLIDIPLQDNSIDIVYTSHSLEPNGGREKEALKELIRITRKAVLLFEPIYELASDDARKRMDEHGYVKGLKKTAEELGIEVVEYGLLEVMSNPLNPSGVIVLKKKTDESKPLSETRNPFRCLVTDSPLEERADHFFADEVGIAYPKIQGVPLLLERYYTIASKLK